MTEFKLQCHNKNFNYTPFLIAQQNQLYLKQHAVNLKADQGKNNINLLNQQETYF